MRERFYKLLNHIVERYLQKEEKQLIFSNFFIILLQIQQALLNVSYIYGTSQFSYITLISVITRPQQVLPIYTEFQYVILVVSICYIINIVLTIPCEKQLGAFGQLLRTGLLNFVFEYSSGTIQMATHSLLILITFVEAIILQGTLNVQTKNFQCTRYSFLDFILLFFNYMLMILYSYHYSVTLIMILAFLMNIGNTINQLVYSPSKSLTIKSILLTIYTVTIYLGVMHLCDIENNYTSELIMIPCIFQIWYQHNKMNFKLICNQKSIEMFDVLQYLNDFQDLKQLNIKKPKSISQKIIYASLLVFQDQDYSAFIELMSISELPFLLIFKKDVIMRKCMHKIEHKIQAASNTTQKLVTAIASLMTSEQQNYTVQTDIINILKEKIRCQQLLLQNQSWYLYKHYIKFTEKLINLKQKLESQYEEFPCDKTQGILGFFYVEIMNDYLIANQLFSIAAMSDEKLKRIVTNQDVFSNKMVYIMSKYDGTLTIKKVSNDAPAFLMKENDKLIGKPTAMLVPPGIAEHHDKLVYQFLHNGQAKFFRKFTSNYLYLAEKKTMISIDFTFEIDLRHDFSFVTIIQPTIKQKLSIIVNQDHQVSCFSEALIEQLRIQQYFEQYIGMDAQKMLPDFQIAICGHEQVENAEIHFPTFNDFVFQSTSTQTKIVYITSYAVDQNMSERKTLFYVVTFDYFRKPNDQIQKSIQNFTSDHNQIFDSNIDFFALINEDSKIRIPYHETSQKRITSSYYQTPPQNDKQFEKIQSELTLLGQQELLLSPAPEDQLLLKKQLYFTKPNNTQIKIQSQIGVHSLNQDKENDSQDRMVVYQDDRSSQISSLQGLRKSKYYKKYELLSKMYDLKSYSASHKLFISMLVFCILFQLLTQIIQLTEINNNLTNLAGDIDLLQIKNYAFQPLETFLVTRYTLLNYRIQSDNKTINASTYAALIKFPRSNLNLGYDQLDSNLKSVFNRPALQEFLENTYLIVYSYIGTKLVGEQFNISLRNSMNILLSYEYTIKMGYMIDGVVQADSPQIYYSYKNYLPMKKLFGDLNEYVLEQTITRSQNIASQSQAIFILCLATLFCFLIMILHYFSQINKSINKHFQLLHNVPLEYVDDDQARLKLLSERIIKDSNILFKYQFHLDLKERQLDNNLTKSASVRRLNCKLRLVGCQDLYYYLFLIAMILLIAGNAFLTYYETDLYLGQYPATAAFYKQLSDVGTDIPTMYAQREILYGKANLWFFNSTDFQDMLLEGQSALQRTIKFANQEPDFNQFLVSNSFQQFYENVSTSNLCPHLPEDLAEKSQSLCSIVMNGNLERGLKTLLIYITNSIQTEMVINQFTSRNQTVYLILEGVSLVSNIIKVVNDKFNIDLANQTQLYTNQINILNILLLSTLFFFIIIVVTFIQRRLTHTMHLVQRLIFLLPIKTIFSDDAFERNLRQLLLSY